MNDILKKIERRGRKKFDKLDALIHQYLHPGDTGKPPQYTRDPDPALLPKGWRLELNRMGDISWCTVILDDGTGRCEEGSCCETDALSYLWGIIRAVEHDLAGTIPNRWRDDYCSEEYLLKLMEEIKHQPEPEIKNKRRKSKFSEMDNPF